MRNNDKRPDRCVKPHSAPHSFRGVLTALITPFNPSSGEIDHLRFQEQIVQQIAGGVQGIVPCGTTGESPTLSFEEHIHVIKLAVEYAAGRVLVLAGTGANSTKEAIALTQAAEKAGADGSLQVAPYYNKPTQEGLFQHFAAIANATCLPLVLYNIPSRCGVDIAIDTVCRLYEARPNIIGVKVANGSTDYATELRVRLGPDFVILSGDDAQTLPFISVGADGAISVVANIFPHRVVQLVWYARNGDFTNARLIHAELFSLTKALFLEGNPIGVKSAMGQIGLDSGMVRRPLAEVSSSTAAAIRKALNGLLVDSQAP